MILKHFNFFNPIHLSSALWNKKTLYMTSQAWSVWPKLTLRMSLVMLIRCFHHFPWINLIHLLICSVYEYGSLLNYVISKLLRKHILLFPQYSSNWRYGRRWNTSILSFNLKIKKQFMMYTLFKACTFYFHAKWISNKV